MAGLPPFPTLVCSVLASSLSGCLRLLYRSPLQLPFETRYQAMAEIALNRYPPNFSSLPHKKEKHS